MPAKKQIQPGEKVPLMLTATERKLVLEDMMCMDTGFEQMIRDTPSGKPVMMTLDDLDDFNGFIAAEANHCEDKKKEKKLDNVFGKVQDLLDEYTDEESPPSMMVEDAPEDQAILDQAILDQAAQIAEFASQALTTAAQLRIKTKPLENFYLEPWQREILRLIPGLSKTIKNKLSKEKPPSATEVVSMTEAVAEVLPEGDVEEQVALLLLAKDLMNRLQDGIVAKAEQPTKKKPNRTTKAKTDVLYQFKFTLLDSDPPIWRRIQIRDCTLDKLHEHIQTAMGWTNSHLHQFEIKGERYGDPELLDDGFEDSKCEDATTTMLSEILPKTGKRFAFRYEYDFGDGWEHEVLYEGSPQLKKNMKYPICLEGERACPPEDIGGVWGYSDFLQAVADPNHEQHQEFVEWAGEFDPDEFDPKKATKEMKKGLPDWRNLA